MAPATQANDLLPAMRRRFPRVQLVGEVDGHVIPMHLGPRVLDITHRGFVVRSTFDFPAGTEHRFQFATGHRSCPTMSAVAGPSRLVVGGAAPQFVIEFTFVRLTPECRDAIDAILANAMNLSVHALGFSRADGRETRLDSLGDRARTKRDTQR